VLTGAVPPVAWPWSRPWPRAVAVPQAPPDCIESLTKTKKQQGVKIVNFGDLMSAAKMWDVRTIIFATKARRDLCYVSENTALSLSHTILLPPAPPRKQLSSMAITRPGTSYIYVIPSPKPAWVIVVQAHVLLFPRTMSRISAAWSGPRL
jgi:hypothetical protein